MDIAVDYRDWNPQVLARKQDLLLQVTRLVNRQLNHPELGLFCWAVLIPAKGGLRGVRLRYALHPLEGVLVEDQREPECLCDGLVCDVVVSNRVLSI